MVMIVIRLSDDCNYRTHTAFSCAHSDTSARIRLSRLPVARLDHNRGTRDEVVVYARHETCQTLLGAMPRRAQTVAWHQPRGEHVMESEIMLRVIQKYTQQFRCLPPRITCCEHAGKHRSTAQ